MRRLDELSVNAPFQFGPVARIPPLADSGRKRGSRTRSETPAVATSTLPDLISAPAPESSTRPLALAMELCACMARAEVSLQLPSNRHPAFSETKRGRPAAPHSLPLAS